MAGDKQRKGVADQLVVAERAAVFVARPHQRRQHVARIRLRALALGDRANIALELLSHAVGTMKRQADNIMAPATQAATARGRSRA